MKLGNYNIENWEFSHWPNSKEYTFELYKSGICKVNMDFEMEPECGFTGEHQFSMN